MSKKSDNAEILKRIEEVLRYRLDGAQFHDIVQFGSEQGWNVTDRQIRKYIARADELLVERQDKSRKAVIARHLAQRMALYARALKASDLRTALAILADEAKLPGLYPENELKELAKLAAAQGARVEELERRLRDAHTGTVPTPTPGTPSPPAGLPPGGDAGEAGGPTGSVPGGPVPTDG